MFTWYYTINIRSDRGYDVKNISQASAVKE